MDQDTIVQLDFYMF